MLWRTLLLLALTTFVAVPALANPTDAQTGEIIPAPLTDRPVVAPPAYQQRDGNLELFTHLAEGTSKSVRALPNNIFVWQNGAWLIATDLSVPQSPVEISRHLLAAQPSDMQVIGNTVYLALRKTAGLLILDYADPANPAVVGTLPGFDLLSVTVSGDRAYCGRGTSGVLVVDLSDPSAPTDITLFDTPGSANGTDIDGNILYVAMGTSGMGVYDVADPMAPISLGSGTTNGFCTYVKQRGGIAFACDGGGLRIFDVSFPTNPALMGTFSAGGSCYEMCFTDNADVIYLGGLPGLFSLMISNPANPVLVNANSDGQGYSCASGSGVALAASRYSGLHVLDNNFNAVVTLENAGFSMKLHLDGNFLYVADLSGGVRIYDLTNPEAPAFLHKVSTDPNCQDVEIADGVLYAVNSNNSGAGLSLTNVMDPAAPTALSVFNTTNGTMGLGVAGNLCVLANGFGGLRTVDISDPMAPALLDDLPFGANATDVMPLGNVAYGVSFGGGMLTVDITDPTAMTILDQQAWGFLNALDMTGNLAWVADGSLGLRVVDISDPNNLVSLVTVSVGGQPRDVVASEVSSYVYLSDDFYGLRQMEISDPSAPFLIGSYPSADRGMGVDSQGGLVVLAGGETGVYIYHDPAVVSIEDEPETDPMIPELRQQSLTAAPNPFNPRLEISYTHSAPGLVKIDIYDARGRHVRTVLNRNEPAGSGSVIWSGTDSAGRSVSSGVYQLRLVTEERVSTRNVTLVR